MICSRAAPRSSASLRIGIPTSTLRSRTARIRPAPALRSRPSRNILQESRKAASYQQAIEIDNVREAVLALDEAWLSL